MTITQTSPSQGKSQGCGTGLLVLALFVKHYILMYLREQPKNMPLQQKCTYQFLACGHLVDRLLADSHGIIVAAFFAATVAPS
jgi:hypothetical protein